MPQSRIGPPALVALLLLAWASAEGKPPPKIEEPKSGIKLGPGDSILSRHGGGACGVACSPDGKLLATSGGDGTIRLLDAKTKKELRQCTGHDGFLRELCFSPDGKALVSGGNDPFLHFWDPATGKETRKLPGHTGGIYTVAFTPDGKTLVSTGFDGHIRIWDLATGKERRAIAACERVTYGLSLSPDGKTFAAGCDGDTTVRLYELATGRELRRWVAHAQFVYGVSFSPDGFLLASGGGDNAAVVWEVATGKEVRRFDGHNSGVFRACFSPDGKSLATASYQKNVFAWDVATGKQICQLGDHSNWVWGLAWTANGEGLVSAGDDQLAVYWEMKSRLGKRAAPANLTAEKCEAHWGALAGENATRAYEAVWALAADPGQAVPLLEKKLKPAVVVGVDEREVARLIEDLDSESFAVRDKASRALEALGSPIEPLLRRAVAKKNSLEVHRRLEVLLRKCAPEKLTPEQARALRALHVLELAATPAARDLVAKLADGDPDARLTMQARVVRARWKR